MDSSTAVQKLSNSLQRLGLDQNTRPQTSGEFPRRQRRDPFFARHNPHGMRVRHFDGLPGTQICGVVDYDFGFHNRSRQNPSLLSKSVSKLLEQKPIAIATYKVKEKAVPMIGIVPVTIGWRDELRRITGTLQIPNIQPSRNSTLSRILENADENKRRHLQSRVSQRKLEEYFVREICSRQESRASSKPCSDASSRFLKNSLALDAVGNNERHALNTNALETINEFDTGHLEALVAIPDYDTYVFQLLAAILQTDSAPDVQQWLVQAPSQEKDLVTNLLQSLIFPRQESQNKNCYRESPSMNTFYEDQLLQQESGIDIDSIRHYNALHQKLFTTIPRKIDIFDETHSRCDSRITSLQSLVSQASSRAHIKCNFKNAKDEIVFPQLRRCQSMNGMNGEKNNCKEETRSQSQPNAINTPRFNMTHRSDTSLTTDNSAHQTVRTAASRNENRIDIWRASDSVVVAPTKTDAVLETINEI